MGALTLMVQGTASSVGKSVLVTGLCRLYARRGLRVLPFKAQNMSNNAGVTPDGGEIGRSQINQAEACGVAPHVDMNPILLKPEADHRSQVVVLGRPWATLEAGSYYTRKVELWNVVTAALDRLRSRADLVIIEGAGSPAELNLRYSDIVNMAVALYARSPVLLVGDIDRGGIFAQLLGTYDLLAPEERRLVRGFVVNKFRGDPALFADGVRILEERSGVSVLGVVPWVADLAIAEEDAVAVEASYSYSHHGAHVDIAVIAFPRIANFDDVDPLCWEPGVRVRFVRAPSTLGNPDAIVLPGTKHTLADLAWLRETGLADAILARAAQGCAVVGLCGGFQMLARRVSDPHGYEGGGGQSAGLRLLAAEVRFAPEKATFLVTARVRGGLAWWTSDELLSGYEIHMGRAQVDEPLLEIHRPDGSVALDGAAADGGRIWGTHVHGIFQNDRFRRAWLRSLGWQEPPEALDARARREAAYDRLADLLEQVLDVAALDRIVGL
ncbi:MAG: cobyric acid synthase [Anaerolineae bacterium]